MPILLTLFYLLLLISHSVYSLPNPLSPTSRMGLNGDTCLFDADCEKPRQCFLSSSSGSGFDKCEPNRGSCICIGTTASSITCSPLAGDGDCSPGERCATPSDGLNSICISENIVDKDKAANVSGPEGKGLTGESCRSHLGCKSPRLCFVDKNGSRQVCAEQGEGEVIRPQGCRCLPLRLFSCERTDQCVQGEKCSKNVCIAQQISVIPPVVLQSLQQGKGNESVVFDDGNSTEQEGNEVADTQPGIVSDAVCIAVHHLGEMTKQDLVFDTHRLANVLCDASNSCATAGHIVVWKKQPMMMTSYCEIVGCTTKVTLVNSPKWRIGKRVDSHTNHLSFSALSARYETSAEEQLMSLAIRAGA